MKYTNNYNLYKPDYDDTIDVNFLNQNMDVLDATVAGLNYVQNVNISDEGLTFIKRDGQQIAVPLNYLKLTGGQVIDGSAEIKSILDWDKMKDVYGSTMTSTTTIYKGKSKTITYPNWCVYGENLGVVYYNPINKDIYLTDDFTNYDEIIFQAILNDTNMNMYRWKSKILEHLFENSGYVTVTSDYGAYMIYHGFYQYGSKSATDVSTRRMLKYVNSRGYIVDVLGVKYTEVK